MNKKVLIIIAVVLVIAILAIVCLSLGNKPKEGTPGNANVSGEVVPDNSNSPEVKPGQVYKELDPYVANIPNEILDFYKEKIEAIEEQHKNEQEQMLEGNKDLDVTSLRNLKYDLVFFDDNNTPELVVTDEGYRTALYTYDAGKVIYTMAEDGISGDETGWAFGAGGNAGYEYIPRENVLRNYNSEYSGLIRYVSFFELDPKTHQLVSKYDQPLYEGHYNDANANGKIDDDEMETFINEPKYFYAEKQISSGDWAGYMIDGDYVELVGTKSADSILKALQSLMNEK